MKDVRLRCTSRHTEPHAKAGLLVADQAPSVRTGVGFLGSAYVYGERLVGHHLTHAAIAAVGLPVDGHTANATVLVDLLS